MSSRNVQRPCELARSVSHAGVALVRGRADTAAQRSRRPIVLFCDELLKDY